MAVTKKEFNQLKDTVLELSKSVNKTYELMSRAEEDAKAALMPAELDPPEEVMPPKSKVIPIPFYTSTALKLSQMHYANIKNHQVTYGKCDALVRWWHMNHSGDATNFDPHLAINLMYKMESGIPLTDTQVSSIDMLYSVHRSRIYTWVSQTDNVELVDQEAAK